MQKLARAMVRHLLREPFFSLSSALDLTFIRVLLPSGSLIIAGGDSRVYIIRFLLTRLVRKIDVCEGLSCLDLSTSCNGTGFEVRLTNNLAF